MKSFRMNRLFDQVPQRCCVVAFDHGIFDVIAACPWPKKK